MTRRVQTGRLDSVQSSRSHAAAGGSFVDKGFNKTPQYCISTLQRALGAAACFVPAAS